MPAAARLSPTDVFTPEEWERLRARSTLWGLALVAHAWAVIIAAAALFVLWPNPLTYLLAVMLIGARQLGLAVLMHEAAHGGLSPHQRLNDWVGQWLCAAPVGANVESYRRYHLQHHKFANQPEDPDLSLAAPFPIRRASLWRKVLRDLTGQTFLKQRTAQLGGLLRVQMQRLKGTPNLSQPPAGAIPFLVSNAVLLAVLTAAGLWWAYFALWLVPFATWNQLVTRLRNIAEHACLTDPHDPYRQARTTRASWWEGLLIAPYWVNFHAEHHMFMHLPCYRLGRAHAVLRTRGVHPRMQIANGYAEVLAQAAPT
ncbi:MAG: fatty acid desaturase family protein [Caulobacterales bacterium]